MLSLTNYTDQELVIQLQAGNEAAFTQLYNRYWERLFFMAHKRLSSAEDAKEIIQTIFFTLWQKRNHLQIQNLSLYLAAMTRYAVYRHLANEKRRTGLIKDFSHAESKKITDSFDIDNKQLLDILTQLTNELPETYRIIFIHHKLMDQPLDQVAEELGVSSRTAERYVEKVMNIMRNHRSKLAFTKFML
jgi:RNA polymerase sigma-70 factor (ECF subfamily)